MFKKLIVFSTKILLFSFIFNSFFLTQLPFSTNKLKTVKIRNPHVLHTQTRMNIIFRQVGSIRPLKNKLYSDEIDMPKNI